MCLASVFAQRSDGTKVSVLDKVKTIDVNGDVLVCRNLFGEEKTIEARIEHIDLSSSIVIIREQV